MSNARALLLLLILICGAILLSGCYVAPKPVYRLKPVDQDTRWNQGREVDYLVREYRPSKQ